MPCTNQLQSVIKQQVPSTDGVPLLACCAYIRHTAPKNRGCSFPLILHFRFRFHFHFHSTQNRLDRMANRMEPKSRSMKSSVCLSLVSHGTRIPLCLPRYARNECTLRKACEFPASQVPCYLFYSLSSDWAIPYHAHTHTRTVRTQVL